MGETTPRCDKCEQCNDKSVCLLLGKNVKQSHFGMNSPKECPLRPENSMDDEQKVQEREHRISKPCHIQIVNNAFTDGEQHRYPVLFREVRHQDSFSSSSWYSLTLEAAEEYNQLEKERSAHQRRKRLVLNPNEKLVENIMKAIRRAEGFCPCVAKRESGTLCPCTDMTQNNVCHCHLFVPVGGEDNA